jgi:hypothetical protein
MNRVELRTSLLFSEGASLKACRELLDFNHNPLEQAAPTALPNHFPLSAEPHVAAWQEYAAEAEQLGVFETLKQRLVQFAFPIQRGISQSKAYQTATQGGASTTGMAEATGLVLKEPAALQLRLYPSLAGVIPILITPNRADFVTLTQALTKRNEPDAIPRSMGACFVANYNNWDRIHALRRRWQEENQGVESEARWAAEFRLLIMPQKSLYQDKFIILSDGPYSDTPAAALQLTEAQWQEQSMSIRLEHECTHYLTRRLLPAKGNDLLNELIADYRGIACAHGRYRADWFLRFMGLENYPSYREGGRLQNYYGSPSLSEEALRILHTVVKKASENLERFDHQYATRLASPEAQARFVLALTHLTIEELASPDFGEEMLQTVSGNAEITLLQEV